MGLKVMGLSEADLTEEWREKAQRKSVEWEKHEPERDVFGEEIVNVRKGKWALSNRTS